MSTSEPFRHVINQQDASKNIPLKTKYEFLKHHQDIVKNWKPKTDVLPLIFGRSVLVGAAVGSAMYINHRFRARMKIRSYGFVTTTLGVVISVSAATILSHAMLVMKKLYLLDVNCPFCLETRAAMLQAGCGVLLPVMIVPFANFSAVAGSGRYNVPPVSDIKRIFYTVKALYQPLFPKFAMMVAFHVLLAGFVTYAEIKSFLHILDMQYIMKSNDQEMM